MSPLQTQPSRPQTSSAPEKTLPLARARRARRQGARRPQGPRRRGGIAAACSHALAWLAMAAHHTPCHGCITHAHAHSKHSGSPSHYSSLFPSTPLTTITPLSPPPLHHSPPGPRITPLNFLFFPFCRLSPRRCCGVPGSPHTEARPARQPEPALAAG